VPERLTVPGMCWALRWERVDAGAPTDWPRYLTLYAMRDAAVVESHAYRRLLSHPTPASRAMRPALRRVSRWICTLDLDTGIRGFDHAHARTVAHDAPRPVPPAQGALLLATRIPDAAPLPWLAGAQAHAIDGDRLEFSTAPESPRGLDAGSVAYRRLPVG
jgi:hypothetical protein